MNSLNRRLRTHRFAAIVAGFAIVALAMLLMRATTATAQTGGSSSGLPAHIGGVHGSVYVAGATSAGSPEPDHIPVVGHTLQLRSKVSNVLIAEADTDVYGRFYFPPQDLGTYTLKWVSQNGWRAGTYPDDIVIDQGTVSVEWIRLRPRKFFVTAFGTVRLADGAVPGMVDEFFGIEEVTEVAAVNNSGVVVSGPVRADTQGRYALAVNSLGAGGRIRARIQGATTSAPIGSPSGGLVERNLVFQNSAPRVVSLTLENASGNGVRGGMGGDVLRTSDNIIDADGDPVTVEWRTEFMSASSTISQTGNVARWDLPDSAGGQSLFAVVNDGRGGYARGAVRATINKTYEVFTGRAVDRFDDRPIRGASVEVNGRFTETREDGFFSIRVPLAERYVLNIREPNYALAGRVFDTGLQGRIWRMVPRQRDEFQSREGVRLVDRRDQLGERRGAELILPPDVLVDPDGRPAQGRLIASFATIDISNDETAGDYVARVDDRLTGLISYGVLSVEITDEGGREYQIRDGASARLIVPIAGAQPGQVPAGAPDTIAIWSYNETDGVWEETGSATLNREDATYEGFVTHFSEINVDAPGADTCIRVLADPALLGKFLRVSDVAGNGIDYAIVKEDELDDPVNVIYTIPPGQLVQLDVLDTLGGTPIGNVLIERFDATNPGAGWVAQPGDNEVLSGAVSVPTFPAYPYTECPVTVTLKLIVPPGASFLHYKGVGSATIAQEYYDQVNPQVLGDGNRDTLQEWWAHNGLNTDGSATTSGSELYARTSYTNDNDLGSGRDMHLYRREDGSAVAWVSNYGEFDQSHGNADRAFNQDNLGDLVATVCMEYSPMENAGGDYIDLTGSVFVPGDFANLSDYYDEVEQESVVKFFVFANADGIGGDELQPAAKLDGYFPKFVPNLCLNCHGGSPQTSYSSPADCSINAYFRELDYETYKFPFGASAPTVAEQTAFRTQNDIVRGSNTQLVSGAAIKELIDVWYRDGVSDIVQDECVPSGGGYDPLSIPSGWNAGLLAQDFYCDVVGRSCRTCHLAFDGFALNDASFFADGSFVESALDAFINNTPGVNTMPHAIVTYRNFWLSDGPHRPTAAQFYIDNN